MNHLPPCPVVVAIDAVHPCRRLPSCIKEEETEERRLKDEMPMNVGFADLQHYPTCGEARYKVNHNRGKKIPHKVLHLFVSQEGFADMRWHRDKRVETNDVLKHPANAKGWKHFDSEYPDFASDLRKVRLGLASDGFNPFGQMSTSYSMWPVVLLRYSLCHTPSRTTCYLRPKDGVKPTNNAFLYLYLSTLLKTFM
ncbi:uncharacterized protein E5676_scaffold325G001080 [Cucumis melo var. makuwa]|uniref:Uncharacterized protein n=1 Tax=Cucumis melo var. makuwa TaxID=1194695 RepID=A0A5D3DV98_CUCMM|nr:uncharacterized protein E5676_scaffold325G001080 [Cucumis melo var. makuwa]